MLAGDNSILERATESRRSTLTAEVYEKLQIETAAHLVDSNIGKTSLSLVDFLKEKEYIKAIEGADSIWQVNVEKLVGSKKSIGNGTATGTDKSQYKDVYVIEQKNTNTGILKNTKVASTNPIKIADTSPAENEEYEVTYYDSSAIPFKLGTLSSKKTSSSKTDLQVLQEYFSGLEDINDAVDGRGSNGRTILKPVNSRSLDIIGNSSGGTVLKYNNEKYVLRPGKNQQIEVIQPGKIQNGDLVGYANKLRDMNLQLGYNSISGEYEFFDEDISFGDEIDGTQLVTLEYAGKKYLVNETGELVPEGTYTLKEKDSDGCIFYLENYLGEKVDIKSEYNPKLTVDGTVINLDSSYIKFYGYDNLNCNIINLRAEDSNGNYKLADYDDKTATITITIDGKEVSWTGKISTIVKISTIRKISTITPQY